MASSTAFLGFSFLMHTEIENVLNRNNKPSKDMNLY